MTTLVSLALSPLLALPAAAPQDPPAPAAERLFRRAAAAADAVRTARYHAIATRRLALANRIWRAEGTVSLDRRDAVPRVLVDGTVRRPRETVEVAARLGSDGKRWLYADDTAGTWASGADPALGGGDSDILARLTLDALVGTPAYTGERAVDLRGPEALPSGEFWVLSTEARDGSGRTSTWYLSTSDLLPRQCDRTTPLDHGEELVERILHGEFEPLGANEVALVVPPEGYERVEPAPESDLAPYLVPPREREVHVASLEASLAPLRDAFEAARGKTRVIGLFAPT